IGMCESDTYLEKTRVFESGAHPVGYVYMKVVYTHEPGPRLHGLKYPLPSSFPHSSFLRPSDSLQRSLLTSAVTLPLSPRVITAARLLLSNQ
ncbi:unnamed protein product, partial [Citrullus colocynthis]